MGIQLEVISLGKWSVWTLLAMGKGKRKNKGEREDEESTLLSYRQHLWNHNQAL